MGLQGMEELLFQQTPDYSHGERRRGRLRGTRLCGLIGFGGNRVAASAYGDGGGRTGICQ